MTLFILLLSAGGLFYYLKRPRIAFGLGAAALLWFFLCGSGVLPQLLISQLQSEPKLEKNPWKDRNIIFLLGGGMAAPWASGKSSDLEPWAASRTLECARLYHQCKKSAAICHVIPSGGRFAPNAHSEAEVMGRVLIEMGLLKEDIILEEKALTTFQNARFTAELIKGKSYDLKVLVTSGFHMYRSLWIYEIFGLKSVPAPSEIINVGIRPLPAASKFYYTDLALHEFVGKLKYAIYLGLGLDA
jgi:uncharacterized SAM-binding protein YcdF (DUF218 family)